MTIHVLELVPNLSDLSELVLNLSVHCSVSDLFELNYL